MLNGGGGISQFSSVDATGFDTRLIRMFDVLVVQIFHRIESLMFSPLGNKLTLCGGASGEYSLHPYVLAQWLWKLSNFPLPCSSLTELIYACELESFVSSAHTNQCFFWQGTKTCFVFDQVSKNIS